jgi:hypothetical protein
MRVKIEKLSSSKGLMLLITLCALALTPPCSGEPSREERVEAAFIYNFTQFVDWPADALGAKDAPFIVGVVGDDALGGALEQAMAGKVAEGRPIIVRHFAPADRMDHCHLLFICAAHDGAARAITAQIGNSPVLVVGESDSIMPAGGSIRLFLEEGRMRFQLAPEVVEAARLKASAKLMKLAKIYRK